MANPWIKLLISTEVMNRQLKSEIFLWKSFLSRMKFEFVSTHS